MNITLIERLLKEADELIDYGSTWREDNFPPEPILNEGEHVAHVASTYTEHRMIYLMRCWSTKQREFFFAIEVGDGGICIGRAGPRVSQNDAESHYGEVPEGWTNS